MPHSARTFPAPTLDTHRPRLSLASIILLVLVVLIILMVLSPIASLIVVSWQDFSPPTFINKWRHLWVYVLLPSLANTLILLIGVGVFASILGLSSAWVVSVYDFRGSAWLSWCALLPLAMPTYIIAYAYIDLLHPLGVVQELMRTVLGYSSPREWRLPDWRGTTSAVLLLSFVLYPYIYLTTRALLTTQGANLVEVARSLGAGKWRLLRTVHLPLLRPALAVGIALVLFETLNDIGAVEFLGVPTLTTAVYATWVTRGDLISATQIALSLLAIVLACVALERAGRRHTPRNTRERPINKRYLVGLKGFFAFGIVALPVIIGFVVPFFFLLFTALKKIRVLGGLPPSLVGLIHHTLSVALSVVVLTLIMGFLVVLVHRSQSLSRDMLTLPHWGQKIVAFIRSHSVSVSGIGYALPGTILAIGLLSPLVWVDTFIGALIDHQGLIVLGTMSALVVALSIRFLVMASGSIEAGWSRLSPSYDMAARSLGARGWRLMRSIPLPLIRPSLISAALLIFVDAMKELPLTLILRPLGVDTLASWIYAASLRGVYEEGAIAACIIVCAGLLPIWLLQKWGASSSSAPHFSHTKKNPHQH